MSVIGYAFAGVLLVVLNWLLSNMSFNGYLGKLMSLMVLVIIASKSTVMGILGVILIISKHGFSIENMSNSEGSIKKEARKADFKKSQCKKGKLFKDDKEISDDDLATAFPNIEFAKEKCNPCDASCEYSIKPSGEQLGDEERLRPRNSKESFISR